jgi:hypothetical protein
MDAFEEYKTQIHRTTTIHIPGGEKTCRTVDHRLHHYLSSALGGSLLVTIATLGSVVFGGVDKRP